MYNGQYHGEGLGWDKGQVEGDDGRGEIVDTCNTINNKNKCLTKDTITFDSYYYCSHFRGELNALPD